MTEKGKDRPETSRTSPQGRAKPALAGAGPDVDLSAVSSAPGGNREGDGALDSLEGYSELYGIARDSNDRNPDDLENTSLLVHCGAVLVGLSCDDGHLADASAITREILERSEPVRSEESCRESLASALQELCLGHADMRDLDAARDCLDRLVALQEDWPDDSMLALRLGETTTALAVDFQRLGDEAAIIALLNILSRLSADWPEMEEFPLWLGRVALSLIRMFLEQKRWQDAVMVARSYQMVLLSEPFQDHLETEFGPQTRQNQTGLVEALLDSPEAS